MAGKIVLSNVGTLGDLHPLIAIALRLKECGYDAVIATSPDFRADVVSQGIAFHPVGPSRDDILRDQEIDAREFGRRISKDALYVLEAASFPYLKITYDDLLPVLEGASLVLAGSMMYSARFAAEKLGIPYLTIALQPMVFLSAQDPPSVSQAPWLAPLLLRLGPAVTRAVYGGQALRAGKPQLVVPFLGDQFDNAARVARLGVGRWIGQNRYSPSRVAGELTTLLATQAFKSRAAAVSRDVDLEDGPEVVARVVDGLLSPTTGSRY